MISGEQLLESIAGLRRHIQDAGLPAQCVVIHPCDWPKFEAAIRGFVREFSIPGAPLSATIDGIVGLPVRVDHRVQPGVIHVGRDPREVFDDPVQDD